jgi:hypothetical protein
LSKYFWTVGSFGGVLSGDAFTKRYELHYQPKGMEIDRSDVYMQFRCLNFHAKHSKDSRSKLSLAVKKQVVSWLDEGMVLLSSPFPAEL